MAVQWSTFRVGLRSRMVLYFALASFAGAVLLSVVTFAATRSYLLDKATSSARSRDEIGGQV
ncbi:MAG: hypothetical protein EBV02_03130, partial [Actinobacteria bacterium]|nr:hypothetical protein [Actinomycetota bacterium]